MDLAKFERIARGKGFQPIGKASLSNADVYVAEKRRQPFNLSDPIESQTHYEILWALANPTSAGQPSFGRTVKVKAADALDQNTRIKIALSDAAAHVALIGRGSKRTH